jgi:hypothetical protein
MGIDESAGPICDDKGDPLPTKQRRCGAESRGVAKCPGAVSKGRKRGGGGAGISLWKRNIPAISFTVGRYV